MNWTCPECGQGVDLFVAANWDDEVRRLGVVPFICVGCGFLAGFLHMEAAPPYVAPIPKVGWELVAAKNPELWRAIQNAQAKIRMVRACGGGN